MGRMQDALKKAAEERERKRISDGVVSPPAQRETAELEFRRPEREPAIPQPKVAQPPERAKPSERPRTPVPVNAGPDERLIVFHAPGDERAEEFRKIRANLLSLDPRPKTIMLTSGSAGEGKSLMAANLALTLLEMGEAEVLLIDANLRHPELAGLFGVTARTGLGELIASGGDNFDAAIVKTSIAGLSLLPAGPSGVDAARQLQPDVLKRLLDRVRSRFGFVIVDTPPVNDFADAVHMSTDVDGVLLVVKIGGGRRSATTAALEALGAAKARLLGTVVMTGS